MRFETAHPSQLTASEWARWEALRSGRPGLAHPFFGAEWAKATLLTRPDARVISYEDGGTIAAFLPVVGVGGAILRLPGADLGVRHGLIAAASFPIDLNAALAGLGAQALRFTRAPAGQMALRDHAAGSCSAWVAECEDGAEDYLARVEAACPECTERLDRACFEMERRFGPVQFEVSAPRNDDTPGPESLTTTFALKAGDRVIARATGVMGGEVLHLRLRDDGIAPLAGVVLARRCIAWAAHLGRREVDFGCRLAPPVRFLATARRPLIWGTALCRAPASIRPARSGEAHHAALL